MLSSNVSTVTVDAPKEFRKCEWQLHQAFPCLFAIYCKRGERREWEGAVYGRNNDELTKTKDLTDSVDLCSAFIVWLTKDIKDKAWLNSRWLAVTWDVDQLEERKEEIVAKDLLRAKLRL